VEYWFLVAEMPWPRGWEAHLNRLVDGLQGSVEYVESWPEWVDAAERHPSRCPSYRAEWAPLRADETDVAKDAGSAA